MKKSPNRPQEDTQKPFKVVVIGLIASIVLNVALGATLLGSNNVSDDYDGDAATDESFYKNQVAQLEADKLALEAQLTDLKANTEREAENGGGEETPAPEEDNQAAVRASVLETANGFIDTLLNVDTSKVDNETRRNDLEPFASSDIIAMIAPTLEELEDIGVSGHEEEGGPEYTYRQKVENKSIYVNEDSLDGSTAYAIAEVVSTMDDDVAPEFELKERYLLTIEKSDGKWVVTDYTMERVD